MDTRTIIHALGGPSAVAERLSDRDGSPTPAAVTMWAQRGVVPYRWRAQFEELAKTEVAA